LRGKNKLFGALDEEALCEIESDLELVTIRGGEDLFRRGDYGGSLYIVIDGRLRVLGTRETGEEWVLAELGQGESVGEMSVLGGGRRSATVYAVRDTNLARLSRSAFERLSAKYPHSIAPIFIKKVIERLQQTNRSLHAYDKLSTISVAPVSDGIDLRTFCFRLSSALSQFGRSIHVDSRQFDELLGFPCTSQIATGEHSSSLVVERMANTGMWCIRWTPAIPLGRGAACGKPTTFCWLDKPQPIRN
jgi:CRP-like cAMP-binding protein